MQTPSYTCHTAARKPRGVVTVTGQAVRIRVRRHALQIEDGFPLEGPPRSRAVHRAFGRVDRVLLLAGSGFATVDALDWCAENGASIVAINQSGLLRWTLIPGQGGEWACRLRRAQALVPFTDTGLEIAKWLITRKLAGQRDVLNELGRNTEAVEALLPEVDRASTIPHLRYAEARGADSYWKEWVGLAVHFAPPSYKERVPEHWIAFRGRGSPLSNGARNAADPVNALLSYGYALLEAEARIACHEAGLDPYLGILHTDQDARRSLLYDVIEPCRAVADRLVLNLMRSHAFRPGELWALRDGRCRLDQDLCAHLWPWMPQFRNALGPVMTFLLSRLRKGIRYAERAGRSGGRRYFAPKAELPPLRSSGVCRSCGVLLEGMRDRHYCADCLPARREEANASILRAGAETLRRLRQEGFDRAHGGAAAKARKESLARHREEIREWERANTRRDPEEFRRVILPGLQRATLREMIRATGLCSGYCSMIRRGTFIPHSKHWKALRVLIDCDADGKVSD